MEYPPCVHKTERADDLLRPPHLLFVVDSVRANITPEIVGGNVLKANASVIGPKVSHDVLVSAMFLEALVNAPFHVHIGFALTERGLNNSLRCLIEKYQT